MPKSATLDSTVLVDSLVPDVIDGLRGDLHPDFGVRAYRLYLTTRTWSGTDIGDGVFSEVEEEIDPQPLVRIWNGLDFKLEPCGLDDMGDIKVTETSLQYTEGDLVGKTAPLAANQEFFIRLREAHGQATAFKDFQHTKPPYIDRIKDMGWVMWLRRINTPRVL